MNAGLRVLAPGLLTTVQDLGRPGHQRLGIPVGGALDPVSLRAANVLVGNAPSAGAIEVAYVGPTFMVDADSVRLAFVGASAPIEILPELGAREDRQVEQMHSIRVRRGEVVRIGSLTGGAVLYVAVEGGFDIDPVLGSTSTYIRGGFGGWQGRALIAGDWLPLCRPSASDREECELPDFDLSPPPRFRTILGPQDDHFAEREISAFFDSEYLVSPGADRMGMRLDGYCLDHARHTTFVSDGIAPGSIQVPGNGQPIVLLVDRQTAGGYPKIATVISADMPALGRVPIGAKIAFEPVSMETAQELRRRFIADVESIGERIVPIQRSPAQSAPMLFDCNLISGVVDARGWM
jgi:biotin-dependent carboxylase-like uncharacterized protein